MPQLNPLDWGRSSSGSLITFGILYLLMSEVALPRIGRRDRERAPPHIANDLTAADKLRRETEEAIAAYEQALAEAKQKAHAIIDEGRTKLKDEVAAERAKLDQELGKKSAEAEARINQAKASAMKDVNVVAADVAADIVRQLIGVAPPKAEIEKAVAGSAEGLSHGIHLRAGILGRGIVLPVPRRHCSISACIRSSRACSMPVPRSIAKELEEAKPLARGGREGARRLSTASRATPPKRHKPSSSSPRRRPRSLRPKPAAR